MGNGALRVIAFVVCITLSTLGCIGPSMVTRGLGAWNIQDRNKWEAELIFLGLVLLHVYQVAGLIDFLILNPIAFWKAPNTGPMFGNDGTSEFVLEGERRVVLKFMEEKQVLRADLFEQGQFINSIWVKRTAKGSMVAHDQKRKIHYMSPTGQDGYRYLTDEEGDTLLSHSSLLTAR